MKNNIMYYYNLNIDNLYQNDDFFYFYYNNHLYKLVIYNRDLKEQQAIFDLNRNMLMSNVLVNEIIPNKDKYIVSIINNIPYLLYKVFVYEEKQIKLNDFKYLTNYNFNYSDLLVRNNWDILWGRKIDYLEYQINQNGKKFPILVDSFSYFVGLAENAISYAKNTFIEVEKENVDIDVISHRKIRLNDKLETLYDPLNIIIDHKSRDLAEYIKLSFFKENNNIFNELNDYFANEYFSLYGIRLLFARILYPSFYFDTYEEIILNKKNESIILEISNKIKEYEIYLKNIYLYLKRFYDIPEKEWLIKK